MSSYTNVFGGSTVQPSQVSLTRLDLDTATTTLYWPTQYVDTPNIVSRIIDVYPDEDGRILILPSALFVSVGQDVLINNPSGFDFILQNSAGTPLDTIEAGNIVYFYLTSNSTAAGTWRVIPFGGGVAAVTSVGVDVPDAVDEENFIVTVSDPESTPVITFAFDGDISSLINFNAETGIACRTAKETWELRAIFPADNSNLTVVNGDGVDGDIEIDLATTVGITPGQNPVTSMRVGNILISANTIVSSDTNGHINLTPNGTGQVKVNKDLALTTASKLRFYNAANTHYLTLSGSSLTYDLDLVLPATAPTVGQVIQYASANTLGWATVSTVTGGATTDNAIARYDGTGGVLQNSGITISDTNALVSPGSITSNTSLIVGNSTITTTTISNSAGPILLEPAVGINKYVEARGDVVVGATGTSGHTLYLSNGAYTFGLTAPVLGSSLAFVMPANDGAPNTLLQTNGFENLSFTTATVAGISSAWGRFGVAGGATNLVTSDNVNSVTYTGAGIFTVAFTTSLGNTNYNVTMAYENATNCNLSYLTLSATGFVIHAKDGAGAAMDPTGISFTVHHKA